MRLQQRAALACVALASLATAHTFESCYGMWPPPASLFGFQSGSFSFRSLSGFEGNKLHYVERGPLGLKAHATVLLLHGWPDSWRSWQRVLPLFDSRFRVIALDQLGFGLSSKPTKASYSTAMFADNLKSFIAGLELDNVFLVGHSLGSFNAVLFAAKYPDKLAGLITLGSGSPGWASGSERKELMSIVKDGSSDKFTYKAARSFQSSTVFDLKSVPTWHFETIIHESMACPMHAARASIKQWLNGNHTANLKDINTEELPTLLIWGEHDEMFPAPSRRDLVRQIRGSMAATIPAAGHSAQWEQPAAFAKLVNKFIEREPPSDAKAKDLKGMGESSIAIVVSIFLMAVACSVFLHRASRYDRIAFEDNMDEGITDAIAQSPRASDEYGTDTKDKGEEI